MLAEDRTFVLELRSSRNSMSLASLELPMKEVSVEALHSGGSVIFEKELQVGPLLKQGASVRLLVKRISLEEGYTSKFTFLLATIVIDIYLCHVYIQTCFSQSDTLRYKGIQPC